MKSIPKFADASSSLKDEFHISIAHEKEELIRTWHENQWQNFIKHKIDHWTKLMSNLQLSLPNAKNNVPYYTEKCINLDGFILKKAEIVTKEKVNLTVRIITDTTFIVEGTPMLDAEKTPVNIFLSLLLCHKDYPSLLFPEKKIAIIINPDPRQMWRDIPVPDNIEYPKKDAAFDYIIPAQLTSSNNISTTDRELSSSLMPKTTLPTTNYLAGNSKCIIAASKRGRSHAHEGKPRDDHFVVDMTDDGWYIAIVADGAGSAPYSREGSRIACETSSYVIKNELKNNVNFKLALILMDSYFDKYVNCLKQNNSIPEDIKEIQKNIGHGLYKILGKAALDAHVKIKECAAGKERKAKEYATTLLMTLSKRFIHGWFVASFWVGDGAIAAYNNKTNTVKLLCQPDEGEYSGQTRFLTMPEIFSSAKSIYERIRFCMLNDFSSLFMMTDGISDAFFESDSRLMEPNKWKNLFLNIEKNLKNGETDFPCADIQAQRLLKWLDFWSPGNHDDRTIVMIH